jgi:hypothetical protein
MGGASTSTPAGIRVNGNLNSPAPSIRMQAVNPSLARVNGLGGADLISGNGTFGTAPSMHLELTGGRRGNDRRSSPPTAR